MDYPLHRLYFGGDTAAQAVPAAGSGTLPQNVRALCFFLRLASFLYLVVARQKLQPARDVARSIKAKVYHSRFRGLGVDAAAGGDFCQGLGAAVGCSAVATTAPVGLCYCDCR